jgi:hypothetical protein
VGQSGSGKALLPESIRKESIKGIKFSGKNWRSDAFYFVEKCQNWRLFQKSKCEISYFHSSTVEVRSQP